MDAEPEGCWMITRLRILGSHGTSGVWELRALVAAILAVVIAVVVLVAVRITDAAQDDERCPNPSGSSVAC